MAVLDFKGKAQAENWQRKLAELNERTEGVLVEVSSSIEEIKTESSGAFVDELIVTVADFADASAEMIKAMKSLETLVSNVIKAITDAIGNAVQNVVNKRNSSTNL